MSVYFIKIHYCLKRETEDQGLMVIADGSRDSHVFIGCHLDSIVQRFEGFGMAGEELFFVGLQKQMVETMPRTVDTSRTGSLSRVVLRMKIALCPFRIKCGEMIGTK